MGSSVINKLSPPAGRNITMQIECWNVKMWITNVARPNNEVSWIITEYWLICYDLLLGIENLSLLHFGSQDQTLCTFELSSLLRSSVSVISLAMSQVNWSYVYLKWNSVSYRGQRKNAQLQIKWITPSIPVMKLGRVRVVLHADSHFHSVYYGWLEIKTAKLSQHK